MLQQRIEIVKIHYKNGEKKSLFFENEAGAVVSVNGLRYQTMINGFLWPELEDMDVDDVYFQQDGATCHTSGKTIGLLRLLVVD